MSISPSSKESAESAAGAAAHALKPDSGWRCALCGVTSTERSCFIVPEQFSKPPHYVRCLTCEQRRLTPGALGGIRGAVSITLFPVIVLLGLGGVHGWSPWLFLICAVLYPMAIVAHEAGHALMGAILGLELGGVGIGYGPLVWKFGVWGLPVQIHAWPFSGRVFLGASSFQMLRTRLWLATLMGPVVNVLLAVGVALWWGPLESLWGTAAVGVWFTVNVILVLSSVVPYHYRSLWGPQDSDGLALLRIPRKGRSQLAPCLIAAPLMRGAFLFESGDYPGARKQLSVAIERAPDSVWSHVMHAACNSYLGQYESARAELRSLMDHTDSEKPYARAAIYNNMAFALFMENPCDDRNGTTDLSEADRLSEIAVGMFPCVLAHRSTRALILAGTRRSDEALQLLEYANYRSGTARDRAEREMTRAFALKISGRVNDASRAAEQAMRLHPPLISMLRSLTL